MQYLAGNVTIMVADLDRAVRFYTEALRLPLGFRAGEHWAEVRGPGLTIGLHPARPGAPGAASHSGLSIGLQVPDLDAAIAELHGRGVELAAPVREGGAERIASFVDPDGTPLYLIQRAGKSDARSVPDSTPARAPAAWEQRQVAGPRPQVSAPPSVPIAPSFFAPSAETTLTWLGASGFALNARGTLLLLDPVITMHPDRPGAGETGHPLLVALPIEASQVPRLDVVCYSHADGDHFGRRTARELARTGARFVGPPPVARELTALGIPDDRQRVARIGQGFRVGAVDITPIRADHPWQLLNSARREPPFGPDDCCGYLLRTPDGTIFFPGDTRLVWDHYQLEDVDVLLLDVSNCPYHLGVENAARLANKLGAPHLIAYHYGTYDAPNSVPQNGDPADVAVRIEDAARRFHVFAPGALFRLPGGLA
jgi:L-ascorbate metabolism protein UlaG (beta-lactamase superfamily)/predicted enzyme related to lactoylglutathione lyase